MTRIIAGEWRGHSLPRLTEGSVRPTTDRARTVLFDTLREVHDRSVLDLYSGTGALGLESLSRGASSLVSIDRDRTYIEEQRVWLKKHNTIFTSYVGDVGKVLSKLNQKFDLIFADPPYAEGISNDVLRLIEEHALPNAVFVYERAKRSDSEIESSIFTLAKEKVVAETRLQIYKANIQ
ncbi:MAG: RsmD family RNA methyltransferase [Candidatus Marinimicrobia bacterium]|nr:RsmD family RNA methyltransferase [Candidatus Neomarinimicrobiota bacterium]